MSRSVEIRIPLMYQTTPQITLLAKIPSNFGLLGYRQGKLRLVGKMCAMGRSHRMCLQVVAL